jgi:hypothetical protein
VHAFIPGLFRVIACLQGFCNPANAGGMAFGLGDVGAGVDMGGWDEAAGNVGLESGREGPKTIKSLVRRIQKNVRNARDQGYQAHLTELTVDLRCWGVCRGWGRYSTVSPT